MSEDTINFVENELQKISKIVKNNIDGILKQNFTGGRTLVEAMRYSALSSGKMIRAYLVYSFCKILGVSYVSFVRIATAIELVHCYSLIHDDLPAMDNDEYRRGQKTCHVKYDEATAILAGDALQSLAFEILSSSMTARDPQVIVQLISQLSSSIGYNGMAGGQFFDVHSLNDENIEQIIHVQKLKTGKLIEISCCAPVLIISPKSFIKSSILNFAHDIGFAYQIKDDLLDVKGDHIKLGKAVQKDNKKGKKNLIDFMGVDKLEKQLDILLNRAKGYLNIFGEKASDLKLFVDYLSLREK